MRTSLRLASASMFGALVMAASAFCAEEPFRFAGTACSATPYLHCPDTECSGATVINQGNVVEMKTRRTYFLDYPCDLEPGEQVTFVLSLHGGGSYGNWQRHYFPLLDYVDEHRLVVATPNAPTRAWSDADDEYLRNIVDFVVGELGAENIGAFWLAGHSQGGMTSNRLLRTDYFASRVDGWLSLSGGRLGGNPGRSSTFSPVTPAAAARGAAAGDGRPPVSSAMAAAMAALRELPAADFSFIYTTGEREIEDLPATSEWAERYSCGARRELEEVVDAKGGYVFDSSRLNLLRPGWGLLPGPGSAKVYAYPDCAGGRVVADVVRLEKGHTEGLEPAVTERLIELVLSAPGGKLRTAAAAEQPSAAR